APPFRIMNFNVFVAILIVASLSACMIFGQLMRGPEKWAAEPATEESEDPLPSVRYRNSRAQPFRAEVTLRGHTEASRSTALTAELSANVVEIVAARGAFAKKGEVLIRLDPQDYPERLAAAESLVALRS